MLILMSRITVNIHSKEYESYTEFSVGRSTILSALLHCILLHAHGSLFERANVLSCQEKDSANLGRH